MSASHPGRKPVHLKLYDVAWLRAAYVEQGKSLRVIAAELHCGASTVHRALLRAGIDRRPVGRPRRAA